MKAMLFLRFLDCCHRIVPAEGEALIRGFCHYGQIRCLQDNAGQISRQNRFELHFDLSRIKTP